MVDRHLAAGWLLALTMTGDAREAARVTAAAWRAVVGSEAATDFRLALLRSVHDEAVRARGARGARTAPTLPVEHDPAGAVVGFLAMTEPQRTAWWLLTAEAQPTQTVSEILRRPRGALAAREAMQDVQQVFQNAVIAAQLARAAKGCERAVARFAGYLEGTLGDRDMRLMHDHVQTCELCNARLDALEDPSTALVDRLPTAPDALRDELWALIYVPG